MVFCSTQKNTHKSVGDYKQASKLFSAVLLKALNENIQTQQLPLHIIHFMRKNL